jgi:replicative DNA helicase
MKDSPSNDDAEQRFLGCVFQDPRIMAQFAAIMPEDFRLEKNRSIWRAMQNLQKDGTDIIAHSVYYEIRKTMEFHSVFFDEEPNENSYIFQTAECMIGAAHAFETFMEPFLKASDLRKLIFAHQTAISEAHEPDADPNIVEARFMERASNISRRSISEDEHIADSAIEVLEGIKGRMQSGSPMGASTGFWDLDSLTGGLHPGELVVVGARTGMGKTSFAMSIAMHAAQAMPVKFFSLEMAKRQITPRALSFYSEVNLKRTLNAEIDEKDLQKQIAAAASLRELRLYMKFEANIKIQEICADCHAFAARHGKGLVVIDHLHYLRTSDKNPENRNIELGKITHALKELAKKLDIPILLLSQLNRVVDRATGSKKPRLSDLRDSGNIEQDADKVLFIHREGYYNINVHPSETDIIVAKNRSGPTGDVKLYFDTNTTKFKERQC